MRAFSSTYRAERQERIYHSNNARQISSKLVESNDLSICVMNIQAFNKDTNKIRVEDEYGQILFPRTEMMQL